MLSSLDLDNKRAKARSLYFDREWSLIGSRSPNNSGRDYDTSWYVPEVRRSVKSDTTGKGGSERVIKLHWNDVE